MISAVPLDTAHIRRVVNWKYPALFFQNFIEFLLSAERLAVSARQRAAIHPDAPCESNNDSPRSPCQGPDSNDDSLNLRCRKRITSATARGLHPLQASPDEVLRKQDAINRLLAFNLRPGPG